MSGKHQTSAFRMGWYGDDFTGATDTLAAVAQGGMKAMLFTRIPTQQQFAACGPLDAIGLAGIARSLPTSAMRAELEPAAAFFASLPLHLMHYKCCSTFDSAPHIGNLAEAYRAFHRDDDARLVPIIGGQPNIERYCAFSTLFAAAGLGRPVHRIDRHPTMSVHPVTPMNEADLRLHLAGQGLSPVAGFHAPAYGLPESQRMARLEAILQDRPSAVLFDILTPDHLKLAGELMLGHARGKRLFAIGPSSVPQAVIAALDLRPQSSSSAPSRRPGPVFGLAGSLSQVTARQVAAATSYTVIDADIRLWLDQDGYRQALHEQVVSLLRADRHVLVTTSGLTKLHGVEATTRIAGETADFVSRIVESVPLSRLGIAGGDTSSIAAKTLPIYGLSFLTTLSAGVTLCRAHSDLPHFDGMQVMFKGGQMGTDNVFEQLVA